MTDALTTHSESIQPRMTTTQTQAIVRAQIDWLRLLAEAVAASVEPSQTATVNKPSQFAPRRGQLDVRA